MRLARPVGRAGRTECARRAVVWNAPQVGRSDQQHSQRSHPARDLRGWGFTISSQFTRRIRPVILTEVWSTAHGNVVLHCFGKRCSRMETGH